MELFDYSKETREINDAFFRYLVGSEIYFDDVILLKRKFNDLLKEVQSKACYSHPHDEVVFGLRD